MSDVNESTKSAEKTTFTKDEVETLLLERENQVKEKTKNWVLEKAEELAEKRAESKALVIAEQYKWLSQEMKKFEEEKIMIEYYQKDWALPWDLTVWKALMLKQFGWSLWLSFMECITWMCFINWRPALYWSVYLSLLTRNGYKIEFLEKTTEKVKVRITWKNWSQEWYFDKKMAETAWIWKNVYLKYPETMLSYKAIRAAQKFLCPEILGWIPLVEEADEIPASNPVTTDSQDIKSTLENSWFEKIEEWEVETV